MVVSFIKKLLALAVLTLSVIPAAWAQPAAAPLVMEIFSSQACVFCPQADRLFADLVKQPNVIGLACHVDYFDVRRGSLAQPFCKERQGRYMEQLHAGPPYTPQMVIQGSVDVMGYKMDAISAGMKAAQALGTVPLTIAPAAQPGQFTVTGPARWQAPGEHADLLLMLYDKPHQVTIAGGGNRGEVMTYYNIVSALKNAGSWPTWQNAFNVTPELTDKHQGFAVLLQNKVTGKILAAGKYEAVSALPPSSTPSAHPPPAAH